MCYKLMTLTANRSTVKLLFKDNKLHWIHRVDLAGVMYSRVVRGITVSPVISNRVSDTLSIRPFSSTDVNRLLESWVNVCKENYGHLRYTSASKNLEILTTTPLKLYNLNVYSSLMDTTKMDALSSVEAEELMLSTARTVDTQIRLRERDNRLRA